MSVTSEKITDYREASMDSRSLRLMLESNGDEAGTSENSIQLTRVFGEMLKRVNVAEVLAKGATNLSGEEFLAPLSDEMETIFAIRRSGEHLETVGQERLNALFNAHQLVAQEFISSVNPDL